MALDALRGAAQGIAGKALKKVAGNIRGGLLSSLNRGFSDLSDLSLLNSGSKFKTKNYTFPLDVEAPPGLGNQGHYVMFYINVQENSKLLFGDSRRMENFGKKTEEMNNFLNSDNQASVEQTITIDDKASVDLVELTQVKT